MTTNFFLGANSGEGFVGLYDQLEPLEHTYDRIILKGGPGVGKSTFMGMVGSAMEQVGTTVEYIRCPGDPDSLDGVVLPELHCSVLDGTAPHVMEPQYPEAVDRCLDLGRFYDLTAAKEVRGEIITCVQTGEAAYGRVWHNLKAARQVELDTIAPVQRTMDWAKARRRLDGIVMRELRRKGTQEGRTQRRFLGGATWRGYLWRFDSVVALCPKVYEFCDHWELAGRLLNQLQREANHRGWDCIACPAPEEPNRLEHLLIPGLGLAFVTSKPDMEFPGKTFRRIHLDAMVQPENRARLRFEQRMASLLREEAVLALREAKEAHDRLEELYNPYVDFDGVRTIAAVEIGRLLSWMG